ncbi:prenyltransferase/squalene oxidase repeat-containing protein [Knoellia subterranea]|uniref:Peptidase n=1 Tax=Knoellia subterranea KCTC 19937 TaxID=1385521 RepID=A0A0A0JSV1_9MICO|nr:prenyltransferase/squalene oxidase repeat-containing protein [Knoellia subterranea]KGN39152.1 peptidase [Knoellia subterranea KCTC 19937]
MFRSALRVRVAAPLALAALALGMPSAALAETTPAPSPTTSASTTPSATATPGATTSAPAASTSPGATETPTKTPNEAPSSSAETSPSTSPSVVGETSPFGRSGKRAGRIAGSPTQQAAHAGAFMVRTLAANGDHYNYPASTYFDGGNTIDAILGLDGAKVGLDGADNAMDYLADNVGGYIGTDFGSLYAGPAGKALLAAVAHGADVTDFGGVDLVDVLLNDSLGAAEPGRFSDLPATGCGFDVCDYSNTIGQSLALIGVGRATGEVPDVAMDFLLDQQCADGGFRGDVDASTCVSDLDATAFAAQALVGRYGPDDARTVKALDFLVGKQAADGSLLNQDGQANTNTVGVAAQAFAAGGRTTALAKAQAFLADFQFDCSAPAALRGGIAFTAADRATLLANPSDKDAFDKLLRATPQATLGLAAGSLLDVTSEGSVATAPALTCTTTPTPTGSASPSATPTATSSVTPTQTPSTTGSATPTATQSPTAGGPGLAYTGASVVWPLTVGAALLLAGAATLLVARRRGAHQ